MKLIFYFLIIIASIIGIATYSFGDKEIMFKRIVADLDKEFSQESLSVNGKIPEWLNGTFVRNGPIMVKVNGEEIPHWFDGLANACFYFP